MAREETLDFIYNLGWCETAKYLNITEEELDKVINGDEDKWQKPHINKNATIEELNEQVNNFITNNYEKLYNKYVKNTSNCLFYQDDKDIFHNSLIQLCNIWSDINDDILWNKFDKIFKTNKWEIRKRDSQMRIKEKSMQPKYEDLEQYEEEYLDQKIDNRTKLLKLFKKNGLNK